ncbi:DUF6355 family natural product biosynthesis protein [Allokutzneria albata]|uniref:DUF6355 family natural product biosynthesis protein n=1 Tax=Allokutzneria albata TaxID=211114 RepID=UPI0022B25583|nr:DUF6355 family natural product biosynthesis protein [Allokutzneria albata]
MTDEECTHPERAGAERRRGRGGDAGRTGRTHPPGLRLRRGGFYDHCESNPNLTVMLRVSRIFGSDFKVCVRPGRTNLQQYSPDPHNWAVTNAWYIGGQFCAPAYYGTVED